MSETAVAAAEQPPSAIKHTPPAPEVAQTDAVAAARIKELESQLEAAKSGKSSDVDLDLDAAVKQLTIKLGGQKLLAVEASIETQKSLVRALAQMEEGADSSIATLNARADSLTKRLADADDDETAEQLEKEIREVEEAIEKKARDDTIRNMDTIYPSLERMLTHVDGDRAGQPPTKEFVEEHLRTSTLRKLNKALSPDKDAEGKS